MGLMLETIATLPAHRNSPGKNPDVRVETIEDAGKLKIPFTTGILVGIGETIADREASLTVIRNLHRRYGHIQEVILQNFCAKEGTPMAGYGNIGTDEMCTVIMMAKDILPSEIAIQIAPNLADARKLIPCGVDDLGGISPITIDYVNPEHSWPEIKQLQETTEDFVLQERLCIYPRYIDNWYPPRLEPLIRRLEKHIRREDKA
jgi:FO synthase subunit 1